MQRQKHKKLIQFLLEKSVDCYSYGEMQSAHNEQSNCWHSSPALSINHSITCSVHWLCMKQENRPTSF